MVLVSDKPIKPSRSISRSLEKVKVIKTRDKFPLLGSPGNGRIECCLQDQFGLLARIQLPKVPEKLKESDIPWQVQLAEAAKHPQVGLEQREQTLGPILVHV